MKRTIIIVAMIVIILAISVLGYFAVTQHGITCSGIYKNHLAKIKPFKNKTEEYKADLEFIYNEIKDNYLGLEHKQIKMMFNWEESYLENLAKINSIKSDSEFYDLISSFISLLRDGHTHLSYIGKNPYDFNDSITQLFRVRYIEDKPIIIAINDNYLDSDLLGAEILSINKVDFNHAVDTVGYRYGKSKDYTVHRSNIVSTNQFWEYFYRNNYTLPNEIVVKVVTPNGIESKVKINKNTNYDKRSFTTLQSVNFGLFSKTLPYYEVLNDNIAYITIPTFNENKKLIIHEFNKIVDKLKEIKVKGVVIDIRNNRGGNSSYRDILGYLTNKEINVANYRMKKTPRQNEIYFMREFFEKIRSKRVSYANDNDHTDWYTWSVSPNKEQYLTNIPKVLLVNERIFSSADNFAKTCLDNNLATVIGNKLPLSGFGMPTSIALPSGRYFITYGFFELAGPKYELLEDEEMKPNIVSELKYSDVVRGKDTQLITAISYLEGIE